MMRRSLAEFVLMMPFAGGALADEKALRFLTDDAFQAESETQTPA